MLSYITSLVSLLWSMWSWTWATLLMTPFAYLFLVHVLSYVIPHLYVTLRGTQNLKDKYSARWALVTGGSSGIGRALVESLASQGLNVVIVAVDDDLLRKTTAEMKQAWPELEFRACGVDLSDHTGAYMTKIEAATKDIIVQCVFCNAGYIVTGCFRKLDVAGHIKNLECNAVHCVRVSHFFLNHMAENDVQGCIVLTSSPAGYIANALAVMYGSTKAFVSSFGASLAVEAQACGVDVTVFNPSPVNSRFLEGKTKLSAFDFAYKFAYTPAELADQVFRCVGRACLLRDIGGFAIMTRWICKIIDFSAFAWIMKVSAPFTGDYQKLVAGNSKKNN